MKFTKIKYRDSVELAFETQSGAMTVTSEAKCEDTPLETFDAALQALKKPMIDILEAPDEWYHTLKVTAVHMTYRKGEVSTIILSGVRPIEASNSPANEHTPPLRANEAGEFPSGIFPLIQKLEQEAIDYYSGGKRAQRELALVE